jgi:transcriptional regulator with XRE-family HTH domain
VVIQLDKNKFKDIGSRIREVRKSKHLSQDALAEIINISPSHMSDIENGKKNISLDIFMRITEALQVSADWLLRTNIPSVANLQSGEIGEILSDCSVSEAQALIKMLRNMKATLREAKQ